MTRAVCLFIALAIAGCAAPRPETKPIITEAVKCANKAQCDFAWQRAQVWVNENSSFRIQLANDVTIQTYGPGIDSIALAYTIVRENSANGSAEFRMTAGCSAQFGGCNTKPGDAINAFHSYMLAAMHEPEKPKLVFGAFSIDVVPSLAAAIQRPGLKAIQIVKITPGSIAEKSGLKLGDVVYEYDGKTIGQNADMQGAIAATPAGKTVTFKIYRGLQDLALSAQF